MAGLAGKVALVTGASSGIGRAIAGGLAAQGAALALVGRNSDRLTEVADEISLKTNRVVTYPLDLTSIGAAEDLLEQIRRDFGELHILVHSAGAFARGGVGSAPVADLDLQYQLNVRTPYTLTQALLPLLKTSQGDVVFINSSAGLAARGEISQYAATKHALKALADSLREEVNADGVRVSSLFVGRTATPTSAAPRGREPSANSASDSCRRVPAFLSWSRSNEHDFKAKLDRLLLLSGRRRSCRWSSPTRRRPTPARA